MNYYHVSIPTISFPLLLLILLRCLPSCFAFIYLTFKLCTTLFYSLLSNLCFWLRRFSFSLFICLNWFFSLWLTLYLRLHGFLLVNLIYFTLTNWDLNRWLWLLFWSSNLHLFRDYNHFFLLFRGLLLLLFLNFFPACLLISLLWSCYLSLNFLNIWFLCFNLMSNFFIFWFSAPWMRLNLRLLLNNLLFFDLMLIFRLQAWLWCSWLVLLFLLYWSFLLNNCLFLLMSCFYWFFTLTENSFFTFRFALFSWGYMLSLHLLLLFRLGLHLVFLLRFLLFNRSLSSLFFNWSLSSLFLSWTLLLSHNYIFFLLLTLLRWHFLTHFLATPPSFFNLLLFITNLLTFLIFHLNIFLNMMVMFLLWLLLLLNAFLWFRNYYYISYFRLLRFNCWSTRSLFLLW